MSVVERAMHFATSRHEGQMYGDEPLAVRYATHLALAVGVASRFGLTDERMVAAIWLHDVVEDTSATLPEIESSFGPRVAEMVEAVTNQPGKNRRERAAATYPRIRNASGATGVKLCDRIANVEWGLTHGSPILQMYVREHAAFREALYRPGRYVRLWAHLDALIEQARKLR